MPGVVDIQDKLEAQQAYAQLGTGVVSTPESEFEVQPDEVEAPHQLDLEDLVLRHHPVTVPIALPAGLAPEGSVDIERAANHL